MKLNPLRMNHISLNHSAFNRVFDRAKKVLDPAIYLVTDDGGSAYAVTGGSAIYMVKK